MNAERFGVTLVLLTMVVEAALPILSKHLVNDVPPALLGAAVGIVAFVPIAAFLTYKRRLAQLFQRNVLIDFLVIAFFGSFVYLSLMLFGAQQTSGINTALLQQTEVVFALLLGYFVLRERVTTKQLFATLLVLTGVLLLVFNKVDALTTGDALLALAPFGLQVSYVAAKDAIKKAGIFPTMAARFLYGSIMLFALSTFLGTNQFDILVSAPVIVPLLALSLFTIASLVFWYAALKRINLSKATSILAPWPAISILFAWLFLAETPTAYQLFGVIAIIGGIELIGVGTYLMAGEPSRKRAK